MSENKYITFTAEDTQEEIQFSILEYLEYNDSRYILVIEAEHIEDENAEAMILKETGTENDNVVYEIIEDDDELYEVINLFRENSDEYDLDIEN